MELREKELACEIVRDLLPLYVDGMVSDVSKKSIDNHLEHCTECSEIYHDMACHLEMETPPAEVSDVKRFLNKTKKMYLLYGLGCLSFIAILVCLIVDLAVNKGITWSLIAGSSCLFADIFLYALSTCKKNKHWGVCPAFRHTVYPILSYWNRVILAFPLWCAYPAIMASCPLVSSAYKNIPKMEHLGLHRIISILGNCRKLYHKTNYGRFCVE